MPLRHRKRSCEEHWNCTAVRRRNSVRPKNSQRQHSGKRQMPFSDATSAKVYYSVAGEGPAFVFIHANPFDHRLWLYQVAQFSSYFKCISVDIRGYGRTEKVEKPYTLADMKDDV